MKGGSLTKPFSFVHVTDLHLGYAQYNIDVRPTHPCLIFSCFTWPLDLPYIEKPPQMEAEASPELMPDGLNYFAGGHVHKPSKSQFKGGLLIYSGCTETVNYDDAQIEKGFYHVKVNEKGVPTLNRVKLETPRRFIVQIREAAQKALL